MKFLIFLLLLSGSAYAATAQSSSRSAAFIAEVYNTSAAQFTQEQMAWLHNKLERSAVRQMPPTPGEAYPKLSSLPLVNKFTPDMKKETSFDPQNINPLKYRINFFSKQDQVFRIDGTEFVLFVKAKI